MQEPNFYKKKHFNLPGIRYQSTQQQGKQNSKMLSLNETNNSYKKKENNHLDIFSPSRYKVVLNTSQI